MNNAKCHHTNGSKPKLVAWAIDYANTHEQGFVVKMCCVKCGAVI